MGFWRKKDIECEPVTSSSLPTETPLSNTEQKQQQQENDESTPTMPRIQPSFVMLGISTTMFARAYYIYHSPLESLFQKIAQNNKISVHEIKDAEVGVRRAAGMAVAGRALKLASLLSVGSIGLLGSGTYSKAQQDQNVVILFYQLTTPCFRLLFQLSLSPWDGIASNREFLRLGDGETPRERFWTRY